MHPAVEKIGIPAVGERASARLDADVFRLVYDRTSRPLRAYLCRLTGELELADDLLQDTYVRLLQTELPPNMSDEWLKNYLYRIATNLARDAHRRRKPMPLQECTAPAEPEGLQHDVATCLQQIKPKERELLWLAYVEQFNHQEIAQMVGAKPSSVRVMLARARQRLLSILKGVGL